MHLKINIQLLNDLAKRDEILDNLVCSHFPLATYSVFQNIACFLTKMERKGTSVLSVKQFV